MVKWKLPGNVNLLKLTWQKKVFGQRKMKLVPATLCPTKQLSGQKLMMVP
nr:MAG TPA: hypothetical protein [Caudoviricetes sp.]